MQTITPDYLLNLAIEADEKLAIHRQAMHCALWMEANNIKEMPIIAPFGKISFEKGQGVVVRKGALIHSSGKNSGGIAARDRRVIVFSVDEGYVNDTFYSKYSDSVRKATVQWAGAGGYWCWTDAENVSALN
jgi:hypothetical protein